MLRQVQLPQRVSIIVSTTVFVPFPVCTGDHINIIYVNGTLNVSVKVIFLSLWPFRTDNDIFLWYYLWYSKAHKYLDLVILLRDTTTLDLKLSNQDVIEE